MTNNSKKTVLESVKETLAPVAESIKTAQSKIEIPEAARDFVKRAAGTAKDRAADLNTGVEKVTSALETAATDTVSGTARASRAVQQAVYQDAEAFFVAVDKFASAKSISEAVQFQADYARERGEVVIARAKATTEFFGKLLADGAKAAQDNMSKIAALATKKAA